MNWGEKNVSVQALRLIQDYFTTAKIPLSSRNELSFISVKATGEVLLQTGKAGKLAVLELQITLVFKLKQRVANGSIALTGEILIRDFSGKDEMATRVICDQNKTIDGVVGNVTDVLAGLADEIRGEGLAQVKEWLNGEFINSILNF